MKTVHFNVVTLKKKSTLSTFEFQESGILPKARSKAISSIKKELEKAVIELGDTTTFTGVYSLIYSDGKKIPWALISYKPTFSFEVFTEYGEIVDHLQLIGGIRI